MGITPWPTGTGAGWKGGGLRAEQNFAVLGLQVMRSNRNGDAGLRKQKHKAVIAQESQGMAKKAQGTDSDVFHCATGLIGWVNGIKRVCVKLNRFSWRI